MTDLKNQSKQFRLYDVGIVLPDGSIKRISASFQIEKPDIFQKILAKYHRKTYAVCLCPGKGEKKLAIKYLETTNTYYLARFPKTENEHAEDCIYRLSTKTVSIKHGEKNKEINPKGFVSLRIPKTLAPKKKKQKAENPEERIRKKIRQAQDNLRARKVKPLTTLAGLLRLLWEKAGLTVWSPELDAKISYSSVINRIRKAAKSVRVSVYKLSEVLITSAFTSREVEKNKRALRFAHEKNARVVFVGFLKKYKTDFQLNQNSVLPVLDFSSAFRILIDREEEKVLKKKFGNEISLWKKGIHTVCMCVCDIVKKEKETYVLKVVDLAFMNVSERFIPVDSLFELQVEEKLRKEGRFFKKPVIHRPDSSIFPDFILLDTKKPVFMEVFEVDSEDYQKRKEEKIETYRKKGKKFWFWEPLKTKEIPSFPFPVLKH